MRVLDILNPIYFLRQPIHYCLEVWATYYTIVNRPRNGYETVSNIEVVSNDNFKQLEVANRVDYATN